MAIGSRSKPETVTLYFCPTCGRQKPPMWGSDERECFGQWRSNVPNREGRTSDHEPGPFDAVVYRRGDRKRA